MEGFAANVLLLFEHRAVSARAGEAVCLPTLSVSVGVLEPKVSQPLPRQSPPIPTRQTASPATLWAHSALRAIGRRKTQRRPPPLYQ